MFNSRFDESGNWECMNTPSESQKMSWEKFIEQCKLLDEVMRDSIHRKMKQDTAAAAIANVKALESLANSQDWGYELRELKGSLLENFKTKVIEWEEKQKGMSQ